MPWYITILTSLRRIPQRLRLIHCCIDFLEMSWCIGIPQILCFVHCLTLCANFSYSHMKVYAYPVLCPQKQRERGDHRVMERYSLQFIAIFIFLQLASPTQLVNGHENTPTPTPWPDQFHALLFLSLSSGHFQFNDLWYDWPRGRQVNFIQKQLGELLYDIEWQNGTTFYYTLAPDTPTCQIADFGVGLPRRDFLSDATYVGTAETGGFLCYVWEKIEFIRYYEDVVTKRPVRWDFIDVEFVQIVTQVMTYEVGAVLPDRVTQAPAYCFDDKSYGNVRGKNPSNKLVGKPINPLQAQLGSFKF